MTSQKDINFAAVPKHLEVFDHRNVICFAEARAGEQWVTMSIIEKNNLVSNIVIEKYWASFIIPLGISSRQLIHARWQLQPPKNIKPTAVEKADDVDEIGPIQRVKTHPLPPS